VVLGDGGEAPVADDDGGGAKQHMGVTRKVRRHRIRGGGQLENRAHQGRGKAAVVASIPSWKGGHRHPVTVKQDSGKEWWGVRSSGKKMEGEERVRSDMAWHVARQREGPNVASSGSSRPAVTRA
jgi:hypothetical protein